MDVFPDTLTVRATKAIQSVDRICSHQDLNGGGVTYFHRIFADLVEMLERPTLTGKCMDDAVAYILVKHHLNDISFEQEDVESFRMGLTAALFHLRHVFDELNPYVHGRLVYRYRQRRGLESVILQLHTERPEAYAGVRGDSNRWVGVS